VAAIENRYDVAILGGGLAGLTLGLQLKRARPETSILIVERRSGPAPEAAFKVGESSVEVSAHYFAETVGMGDHLEASEYRKGGLRFFFPSGDNSDITRRVEWGMTGPPPVKTYQIDRGRFENELAKRNLEQGNDLRDGCTAETVELRPGAEHNITLSGDGEKGTVAARWIIDATGPRQLLKRQLGLEKQIDHTINAAWFRLAGGLDYEQWGAHDADWMGRMDEPGFRHHSTTHLMGMGYWVWLIPLASGPVSIGIVADPRFHTSSELGELGSALDWLARHEPQLAAEVTARRDQIADFHNIEDFAYGCERVFSSDRWAMTGVSGVFLDPFYSPGSDFIAFANTMITQMIERDLAGENIGELTETLNGTFLFRFEIALNAIYKNNYQFWGNAEVMVAKILVDHFVYWSVVCPLYFHEKATDFQFAASVQPHIQRMGMTRMRFAQMLREWHELGQRDWSDVFVANNAFPGLWERLTDLHARLDDDELRARYEANAQIVEAIAVVAFHRAAERLPGQPLPAEARINPAAISLDPDRWKEDGLVDENGLTLEDALARVPGVEQMLLGEHGVDVA
jgi:flavin-dependent dehydrogenase